ncbi:hypothetical protein BH23BAC1_BH23BAC1_18670 [soil metagenome]
MKLFRLPRKIKKSLKGNIWLYPADEKGNSLMAFPSRSQEDYTALKQGIVRNLIDQKNAREGREAFKDKITKEIIVSDEELKRYVNEIIREDLRTSSYNTLIAAKNNPKAVIAYYNFVNAYQLYEKGDSSYRNICCLSLDKATGLLKKKKKI